MGMRKANRKRRAMPGAEGKNPEVQEALEVTFVLKGALKRVQLG
jgi:hypothetical protein